MNRIDMNAIKATYENNQMNKILQDNNLQKNQSETKLEHIDNIEEDKKLRKNTNEFEALILKFMLETSLKLDDPLYPKQPGGEIYQSMYKDMLSNELSGSFGYSELLFNFLKEQQRGK